MFLMDMWAIVAGLASGAVGGFIGGSIFGWFAGWQYSSKIIELDRKINQIWGSFNSGRGVDARAEQSAEMQAALAEAMQIWKGEGTQEEKTKQLMNLAGQHPAVAMKILRQLGIKF